MNHPDPDHEQPTGPGADSDATRADPTNLAASGDDSTPQLTPTSGPAPIAEPGPPAILAPAPGAGEGLSAGARQLVGLSDRALELTRRRRSEATEAAYASDWRHFTRWCTQSGERALPAGPATVANYLAEHAPRFRAATADELARGGDRVRGTRYREGATPATLRRRLVSIRTAHHEAGWDDPTVAYEVRGVLAGITRSPAAAGRRVATAATGRPLLAMLATTTAPDPALEDLHEQGQLADDPTGREEVRDDPRDA